MIMSVLEDILCGFEPITLDQMSSIKLLNRTVTKYVTDMAVLERLLSMAQPYYYVQEQSGGRNMPYGTLYFDTPDCRMFREHERGKLTRYKVRIRTYESSGTSFLEVKHKNNHGRTKKTRIETDSFLIDDDRSLEYLAKRLPDYDPSILEPRLQNHFRRITLVNKQKTERLTIDTALRFENLATGNTADMGKLVGLEIKRDGLTESPMTGLLSGLRVKSSGFSKYCIGSALTDEGLKQNNFKEKISRIKKLTE